jgi:hypothetical protein
MPKVVPQGAELEERIAEAVEPPLLPRSSALSALLALRDRAAFLSLDSTQRGVAPLCRL